jgi:hypothetical protein
LKKTKHEKIGLNLNQKLRIHASYLGIQMGLTALENETVSVTKMPTSKYADSWSYSG